tara:strand:+ start:241 stop:576 length:336 start_codon:yes stop_codon:yes gene_type:complete
MSGIPINELSATNVVGEGSLLIIDTPAPGNPAISQTQSITYSSFRDKLIEDIQQSDLFDAVRIINSRFSKFVERLDAVEKSLGIDAELDDLNFQSLEHRMDRIEHKLERMG